MNKKNVILIMIDGGRRDYSLNSNVFSKIKKQSVSLSQSITYGPHTIAAMHSVFSGSYGSRTGTNSYWSTFKFKKNKFDSKKAKIIFGYSILYLFLIFVLFLIDKILWWHLIKKQKKRIF